MSTIFHAIGWFFTLVIDHTFGYLYEGVCWLITKILPSSYTLIITQYKPLFWQGIKITMGVSLAATFFGFLVAIIFGVIRSVKIKKTDSVLIKIIKKGSNGIIRLYVTIFRGTPMMVQAIIIYYGLLPLFHFSSVQAALIIVSINSGAYLTEVIREAIESVDKGQTEAARSLGFSSLSTLFHVVFPQAIKNCMASIGNEFVINIKDTSVLNVIGCTEMFFVLKESAFKDFNYMEQMIVGAIFYLILTLATTAVLKLIEKKMNVPLKDFTDCN